MAGIRLPSVEKHKRGGGQRKNEEWVDRELYGTQGAARS